MSKLKHVVVPLPHASLEERAHVAAVQGEVRAFLESKMGVDMPEPALASMAIHMACEQLRGARLEFGRLSFARLLAEPPGMGACHPLLADFLLCVWRVYAEFLLASDRVDAATHERLVAELRAGADEFYDGAVHRYLEATVPDAS